MLQILPKNKLFLSLVILWICTVSRGYAVGDTIVTIKHLQYRTENAIQKQDYSKAISYLNTASKLSLQPKYWRFQSDVDYLKAKLFYDLQFYKKAQSEAEKTIENLDGKKDSYKLAHAYSLYGLTLIANGDYPRAEVYLDDAESIFIELDSLSKDRAIINYGHGQLYFAQKNYKQAIVYFRKAIAIYSQHGEKYMEIESTSKLAHALSLIHPEEYPNSIEEAEIAVENLIRLSEEHRFPRFILESHRINQQIYIHKHDLIASERERNIYIKQRDSLRQIHLSAIEDAVQAESAIGDLNKIIASQKDDINRQEKTLFFGKLTGWLSIALIIILSLLTLSLYKNNNLRTKANELLQEKNSELQQAKEKAERASLAKAQFLSTITHELRTPMYTVTGLTHLLLAEDPKPEQTEHLNSLKLSGEYLLSLINNLLDLNKLEVNKVELEKIPFELKSRLKSVLATLTKSAEANNNKIHFEYDENIPNKIIGDSLRLSQIIVNLVSNSIKFTKNGDIWVRMQVKNRDLDKVCIHFEVEDNGDGVSKKQQKIIFDSFSQGSLQINRKHGGSGLGLSIVKNLLNLMGSSIELESNLGKGSKFHFDIEYHIFLEKPEKPVLNNNTPMNYQVFENKKVLIVEDNKINQMITKKILENKKMDCIVTDNGTDAITLVRENDFDIILMDIHMPGISGIEATQKIREFNTDVSIIALTAVTIEENLEEFYKAGFNEFIPKPFNAADFFEKIYQVLQKSKKTIKK